MEVPWTSTEAPWEFNGNAKVLPRKHHGSPTEAPQKPHITPELPRNVHEASTEASWKPHGVPIGSPMEAPWEHHGNITDHKPHQGTMEVAWKSNGSPM